jgi:PAS domain S-box-containing protein
MSVSMTNATNLSDRLDPDFYRRLFDHAGLPIFACDLDGNILGWNSLAGELYAACHPAASAPHIREVLPAEQHPIFAENLRTLLETREPLEFRTRVSEERGEEAEYAVWLTPVIDSDGGMRHICVWFHDITARVQLRRGMRKRERLTSLGALAGSVAHHYNNLLCSIATSLEFALNMNTIAAMRRVLRRTADAVGRATQLTQQLLAFAQADHRMCDLADLTEIVLLYFDQHETDLISRGIRLELHRERVPFVPLPRDQFNIVIDNLVRNASEAMPRGGVLTVTLNRRDEHNIRLAVSDTGPGIAPEHMEHLFEPFFTTKGELSEGATRQAGMGLAVVHGLISEMHGSIAAYNNDDGGARFEIILPVDLSH